MADPTRAREAGPTPAGSGPDLSVWVIAYDVRPTLGRALESLRSASLRPERFETLVLSSVPAPEGIRVPWIRLPREPLGRWIGPALAASRGRLIAFLDDDDAYEPGKLDRSLESFEAYPTLGYYHHAARQEPVGPASPRLAHPAADSWAPEAVRRWVSDSHKSPEVVADLWRRGAAFNHSSVVVRRELLEGFGSELAALERGITAALFYAALVSPFGLLEDPAVLTRYGTHPDGESPESARSPAERWRRWVAVAARRGPDAERLLRMVEARRPSINVVPLVRTARRCRYYELFDRTDAGRRELVRAWAALVRGPPAESLGVIASATAAGILRGIVPETTSRLLRDSGRP